MPRGARYEQFIGLAQNGLLQLGAVGIKDSNALGTIMDCLCDEDLSPHLLLEEVEDKCGSKVRDIVSWALDQLRKTDIKAEAPSGEYFDDEEEENEEESIEEDNDSWEKKKKVKTSSSGSSTTRKRKKKEEDEDLVLSDDEEYSSAEEGTGGGGWSKKSIGGNRGKRIPGLERQPANRWTSEEDKVLLEMIENMPKCQDWWTQIAKKLGTKTPSQCYQHWNRVLSPSLKKGEFTVEEEQRLINLTSGLTPSQIKWARIAEQMEGRPDTSVRYQFMKYQKSQKTPWGKDEEHLLQYVVAKVKEDKSIDLARSTVTVKQASTGSPLLSPPDAAEMDWVHVCKQLSFLSVKNYLKKPKRSARDCKLKYTEMLDSNGKQETSAAETATESQPASAPADNSQNASVGA